IWGTTLVALWIALRLTGSCDERESAAPSALGWPVILCAAVALMIACTLSWHVDGLEPRTPETAKLNLLGHMSRFRTLAFDFNTLKREGANRAAANMRISSDRQRRPLSAPALFTARDVPAGLYGIQLLSPARNGGTLTVRTTSTPLPLLRIPTKEIAEP